MILRILVLPVALLAPVPSLLPGAEPDPETAKLIAVLQDPARDNKEKTAACRKLAEQGPKAASAVPTLISILATDDTGLGVAAADALGETGPQALPEVVKALRHKDRRTRTFAVLALSQLSGPNEATLPGLAVLQADPAHPRARSVLKTRLATVLKHLVQRRRRPQQPPARGESLAWIAGLEALGPDARSAVPLLKHLAEKDSDQEVRRRATQALKDINTPARKPGNGGD